MGSYAKNLNTYKEQSINTMTDIEMLTTLYNQAIKHLNRAKISINNKDFDLLNVETTRAREVISYMSNTLDRKYPISDNLSKLYEFMNFEIARFTASLKRETADEVIKMLTELRDTFILANKNLSNK